MLPVSATAVAVTATFTPTDSVDYAGQSATASITVTPATLTVAANNATRAFAAPDPSFTDTITGYVNGDTAAVLTGAASLTASDTAASPVGTYPITAALGTLTAKNYIFAFTPGTLTITQASASAYTITWPSQSIVYGTAIGGATGIKASASIAGSFTYSPAGVLPVSATAVAVTATFTPADSVDYAGQSATAGITVTPATLTVAANNATRAFAAPDPGFTDTITGYVNGDTAAVLTGAASLTASDTAASPVGTYPITAALGTLSAKNYIFAFTPGTLTITQAGASAYTITWPSQSIVYGTAIGGATGIKASASIAGSFTYSPAGVLPVSATAVAVTATFTPTDSVDYAGQSATASITVTPATLTVAANNATRAFAAPDPGFTASITGYVNGDTAAVLTGAASLTASDTAASPVGTYPITAALGTLTAKNYIFAFTPGTLTITQAGASAYTITWPSQSIVYGTAIGGATGIKASASIAGSFTYSPAGVLPVSATAVAVTATFTPTDSVDYAGQSATAGITVTPATLTVAANNATRAFAAPDPGFTASITGYVNGDTAAVLTGAASLTASDTAASPVGTYPITAALGTLTAKNYIFAFTPGTLTITQASASVTWTSASVTYGAATIGAGSLIATSSVPGSFTYSPAAGTVLNVGSTPVTATFTPADTKDYTPQTVTATITVTPANLIITATSATRAYNTPNPSFTGTISGAVNTDTFTESFSTTAVLTSPVGTYPVTPTAAGANLTNYTITTTPGTLTVAAANAIITWVPSTVTYGSATIGAGSLIATSSVPGSFTYSPAAGTVLNVGSTPIIATFTPTDTKNYTTQSVTATVTVTPAVLTVTASNATRTYNTPNPSFTGTISGAVNGDTFTESFSTTAVLASTAGPYPITPTAAGANLGNYIITTTPGTLTITQAAATITWAPVTVTYGSSTIGAGSLIASSSVPGSFTYSPAAGTALNVGSTPVTATFTPTDTKDYTSQSVTATITVTPATLTVTAANATRTYGAANPIFSASAAGTVNGDTFNFTETTIATAASPVGSYPIVPVATGTNLADYNVVYTNGTLTIGQATLTVTAANATRTYGAANPIFSASACGTVNGDTFIFTETTIATAASPVGSYPIVPVATGTNLSDYNVVYVDGTLTVGQATLTLTAGNANRTYGAANPIFSASAAGTVNGDTFIFTESTTATTTSPVGSYPIVPLATGANLSDYTVVYDNGTLTIGQATPVITWTNPSIIIYGTALSAAQLNATSSVAGSLIYSPALGTIPAAGTDTLTVTFTPTDATDYTGATMSVQLTVAQATPVINWPTPASIVYGTALSGAQLNASAFQANGTTPLPGVFVYNPPAGTELSVGSQELSVTFTPTDTSDFTSVTKTVSLTVTQSTLTASANNFTRLYGTANPTFTGTVTGAKDSDTFTESFATSASVLSQVGQYAIVPSVVGMRPFGLHPDPPERNAVSGHSGTRHSTTTNLSSNVLVAGLNETMTTTVASYHQWHTDRNRQFLR